MNNPISALALIELLYYVVNSNGALISSLSATSQAAAFLFLILFLLLLHFLRLDRQSYSKLGTLSHFGLHFYLPSMCFNDIIAE